MRTLLATFRVIGFLILSFFVMEWIVPTDGSWAIVEYPIIWVVLAFILFLAIVLEIVLGAMRRVFIGALSEEARTTYSEMQGADNESFMEWFERISKKLMASKPMAKEEEIVLDHEYDGIRELDNILPPWWVYLFWGTIIFAVVYLVRYHIFDGTNQYQELENELVIAEKQIAEYKKNNKDLIDADNVQLLTDASDLAAGKTIYADNCIACHKDSGGGSIGPNLTDDFWILGGGIKNIYHTISEGGRPGKGMIAWKSELKPLEMAQVASYVVSLHGSNPTDGKEPEGELWKDGDTAPQTE